MNVLNRLKIKAKLVIVLGVSAVALVITVAMAASILYRSMFDERIAKLHAIVESATGVAQSLEDEVVAGHMTREQAIDRFRVISHSMWYDNHSDYIFMSNMDGVSIANAANPKQEGTNRLDIKDKTGKSITGSFIEVMKSADEGTSSYYYPKPGQTEPLPKLTYLKRFRPWNAFIASGVYTDDIDAEFHKALFNLGGAVLVLMLIAGGVVFVVNRNITSSLGSLKGKMEKLAAGDLTVAIDEAKRADEIGEMGRTVEVFRENAQQVAHLQQEQDQLKKKAEQDKKAAMQQLAGTFEAKVRGIVDGVSSAAGEMQKMARSMASTADGSRQQSLAAASGANQATANVQTVAAASEELSTSITEIGRQVTQASSVSRKAAEEGERTNKTVSGLAESAQRIGEVVALINDIASQTNLLALNATIEAARAGEAGKGFAVVASEVKSLANQTAKATDDIRAQVAAIQAETHSAVDAIQGISKTILEVNEISSSIAAAVEEQTAATQEITRNVQQAATGTQEVSRNMGGVTQAVEQAGSTANQVLTASDSLAKQAAALRSEVDHFLNTIRAA
ncbi:MAG TPA: methyl-accepting chemotaxis protein [Stellaceae bacterium]|nr:methyl-accepting chemotaxis protein [Stellaceae bacterium]